MKQPQENELRGDELLRVLNWQRLTACADAKIDEYAAIGRPLRPGLTRAHVIDAFREHLLTEKYEMRGERGSNYEFHVPRRFTRPSLDDYDRRWIPGVTRRAKGEN